ncbi:hypothetical protein M408DRAFT_331534 [Serendipita vermifera MAFF 305830]|uniref:EF-hand domain-containing protein n=1 Tax=Serendipita vermifera MAFF 305830 TaxID=933852 RepID=A0A0C2X6D5_SERVB|nr:hypothetical protein M408DRAFT_331534 [Serendipita vermifera MAFF 305830]
MRALGQNPTQAELQSMIKEVKVAGGDGSIDFGEFLSLMASHTNEVDSEEELKEAFKAFDRENSGSISVKALGQIMTSIGETLSPEELNEMIRETDVDGDGRITYEEFSKWMLS